MGITIIFTYWFLAAFFISTIIILSNKFTSYGRGDSWECFFIPIGVLLISMFFFCIGLNIERLVEKEQKETVEPEFPPDYMPGYKNKSL